jgi:sugar transferase (PEP-CTERM/EpsH1 system associated)
MKILLISPIFPYPPDDGGKIRSFNLIKRLGNTHEVCLIALSRSTINPENLAAISQYCMAVDIASWLPETPLQSLQRYLLSRIPPGVALCYHSTNLGALIAKALGKYQFDIIQIEHSYMAKFLDDIDSRTGQAKRVLTMHNIEFIRHSRIARTIECGWEKVRYIISARRYASWELDYASRFDKIIAVSETDKQLLQEKDPSLEVEVVPNGVDLDFYQTTAPPDNSTLVYVGGMSYPPNVDAVLYFSKEIFPIILEEVPQARFMVVGGNPPPEVLELDNKDHICITGYVEDVREYVDRAQVAVIPLRSGGGTRLKILEAMAMGRPVVSTTVGCEGLDVENGENILLADEPREFAADVVSLMRNPALLTRLAQNGRKLVEERYDWDCIADDLQSVYSGLVPGG